MSDYLPIIIAAEYLNDYKIELTFDNGQQKIANYLQWLNGEIFEPLKDKNYFKTFFLDGWTIAWSNGADIAPETLYENSEVPIKSCTHK
ncbi:MAG: DUF2442 domain-containing protein [Methylococcaceae bacterium]